MPAAIVVHHPDPGHLELVVVAMALPSVIPALPVIYAAGARAWQLPHPADGEPTWAIAAVYGVIVAAVAPTNVITVVPRVRARSRRRATVVAAG